MDGHKERDWAVQYSSNGPEIHPADDTDGDTVIADIDPDKVISPEQAEAIAYLMAAAPKLLGMCRIIQNAPKELITEGLQVHIVVPRSFLKKINTAIAAAKK